MTTNRNITKSVIFALLFAFSSCNFDEKKSETLEIEPQEDINYYREIEPDSSTFPTATNLDSLPQTDFVITLENPITENKNIIYAPTFLYAWDKIKTEFKIPIIIDKANSTDFKLLNKSKLHKNSLKEDEYSVTSQILDGAIIAKAIFNKALPFKEKLDVLDKPINFDKTKVSAFGMNHYDEDIISFTQILY
jgi:hypothetical protein